ncbi:hypothetical protein NUSPORA_00712 [Nucleospora cyclopteri]
MKNAVNRLNTFGNHLFNFTVSLLFVIFAVTRLQKQPKISSDSRIVLFGNTYNNCYIRFIPNIDLSSQFNINTKQIFLYCISKTGRRHEMCWSKIVKRDDPKTYFQPVRNSYPFKIEEGFNKFDTFTFELRGHIYPYVGMMMDVSYGEFTYYKNKK